MAQDQQLEAQNKKQKTDEKEEFFQPLGQQAQEGVSYTGATDAEGHPVQEIESLCMKCGKDGVTRLLLTSIPFFREVVIMSFECSHCGFKNSEMQPASKIQEKGCRYMLKIENVKDFNRQVVKSETCTCEFKELELEIPAQKGQIITIEGLLSEMIEDLSAEQEARKTQQPEIYEKIEEFIAKVKSVLLGSHFPLTFVLDDPSGNSWVEFIPGEPQHKWSQVEYTRTPQQNVQLGLVSADEVAQHELDAAKTKDRNPTSSGFISDQTDIENFENEVQTFQATCPSCYASCSTNMKMVNIPHFKEVIIMATVCDRCGYKSNEVKTGGAIPDKGKKISLKVVSAEDLARDILKSETCGLTVPELHLDLTPGTLGGRFTTIEGLLRQVQEELHDRVFTETSDSMDEATKTRWETFLQRITDAADGKIKFTIIMEDPLASSYIQNVYAPDPDPNMTTEEFVRSKEVDQDLGITDMHV
ncbi:BA75_04036T0 [Komagataella pastoris]|uniref:BA75_04036T0 n=1 Tax=Komagataella pastoris TaxID=4922 RepID=A0A1B2JE82_PICPA|nr:BA75_04036T0 [Komagataella pastoris]